MNEVSQHLREIKATLPEHVSLVAVSKFHPVERLMEAYESGQRIFGESRVQELREKEAAMPRDIAWHFIGHLQLNKVKYIAPYVSLIHAVDSLKLLQEIDRQAARNQRTIPCLLQLHVAKEETKFGFTIDECRDFLSSGVWKDYPHARISGLMCMASNTPDMSQVRAEFREAFQFFKTAKAAYFPDDDAFSIRSWGMSHDYITAIEEGSTMVRVGTSIFGERQC